MQVMHAGLEALIKMTGAAESDEEQVAAAEKFVALQHRWRL